MTTPPVYSNITPDKGLWGASTLNIPGLLPVNIGSSDPYPVNSWGRRAAPQQQPDSGGGQDNSSQFDPFGMALGPQMGDLMSILASYAPPHSAPASTGGGGDSGALPPVSTGFDLSNWQPSNTGAKIPTVTTQEGPNLQPGGPPPNQPAYDPASFSYQIQPNQVQGHNPTPQDIRQMLDTSWLPSSGQQGGSNYFDRFTSAPDISGGNVGQAAINAGGLFSPIIPALAGIAQGFNLYNAPDTTGNPLADVAGTPGALQTLIANGTNWIDRQFGGERMPSSYIPPTPMGPNPDGSAYAGMDNGRSQSAEAQQQAINALQSGKAQPTAPLQFDNTQMGYTGAPMYNLGGADIFNAIGASPLSWQDRGGAGFMPDAWQKQNTGPSVDDLNRWAALNSTGNQWLD